MNPKQTMTLLIGSLLIFLTACGQMESENDSGNNEDETNNEEDLNALTEEEAQETADKLLNALSEEEFDEAESLLSENMMESWSASDLEEFWLETMETSGAFAGLELTETEEEATNLHRFTYEGSFGERPVSFDISVEKNDDESLEISQFNAHLDDGLVVPPNIGQEADQFINSVVNEAFEEATGFVDDDLEVEMTTEDLENEWNELENNYGGFEDIQFDSQERSQRDVALMYIGTFEDDEVLLNVYLNDESNVVDFYSRPYDEEEQLIYPEEAHENAEDFLNLITEENYEEAANLMDDSVESEDSVEQIGTFWRTLEEEYGEFNNIEFSQEQDDYGTYPLEYTADFENETVRVIVYMSRDNEVAGFLDFSENENSNVEDE